MFRLLVLKCSISAFDGDLSIECYAELLNLQPFGQAVSTGCTCTGAPTLAMSLLLGESNVSERIASEKHARTSERGYVPDMAMACRLANRSRTGK